MSTPVALNLHDQRPVAIHYSSRGPQGDKAIRMRAFVHCLLVCSTVLLACGQSETNNRTRNTPPAPGQDHPPTAGAPPTNQPQGLRPVMQQLAVDMSALTSALWVENYDEMILRSRAIANHADIPPAEMQRIRDILGRDVARFEFLDEQAHIAAHRMYAAAQARKLDAFLRDLADVQRGCASCHTQFRGRLRTTQR